MFDLTPVAILVAIMFVRGGILPIFTQFANSMIGQ
jgi:hypothetical protein